MSLIRRWMHRVRNCAHGNKARSWPTPGGVAGVTVRKQRVLVREVVVRWASVGRTAGDGTERLGYVFERKPEKDAERRGSSPSRRPAGLQPPSPGASAASQKQPGTPAARAVIPLFLGQLCTARPKLQKQRCSQVGGVGLGDSLTWVSVAPGRPALTATVSVGHGGGQRENPPGTGH